MCLLSRILCTYIMVLFGFTCNQARCSPRQTCRSVVGFFLPPLPPRERDHGSAPLLKKRDTRLCTTTKNSPSPPHPSIINTQDKARSIATTMGKKKGGKGKAPAKADDDDWAFLDQAAAENAEAGKDEPKADEPPSASADDVEGGSNDDDNAGGADAAAAFLAAQGISEGGGGGGETCLVVRMHRPGR